VSHVSHDLVKLYLERERLTASDVWLQVKSDIVVSEEGFVVFDDTRLYEKFPPPNPRGADRGAHSLSYAVV
jgi:hypothetical protein